MSEWSVTDPQKLTFDAPVRDLRIRIVNGTVNVVGTDAPSARLEALGTGRPAPGGHPERHHPHRRLRRPALEGLPQSGSTTRGWRRTAVVSLAVPADTRVEVGVVGAGAVALPASAAPR